MNVPLSFTSTLPSLLMTRWNCRFSPATASFTWKASLSGPVDGGPPGLMVHGPDSGQHEMRPVHDPEQHSAQPTADPGTLQSTTPMLVGLVLSARTFVA